MLNWGLPNSRSSLLVVVKPYLGFTLIFSIVVPLLGFMLAGATSILPADYFTYAMQPLANAEVNRQSHLANSTTTTLTFGADADARVEEASPNVNYGRSGYLRTNGGNEPDVESYLRFTVSGPAGTDGGAIAGAKLRLYAYNGNHDGPSVYATSNTWTEDKITWSTRPPRTSSASDDLGIVAANSWIELDVTALVRGNGTYSFVIAQAAVDGMYVFSRQGSTPPQLVVNYSSSTSGGANDAVLVGAGDIASCDSRGDEATALLLDSIPGTIFTAGDNAYGSGSAYEFANCYHPSWGRHKARTRPAPGNHEYLTSGAKEYYNYFGPAAGDPSQGYYGYNLGQWRVIALNSNCGAVGGCHAGSPQEQWLRRELYSATTEGKHVVAYWHHARFSSGSRHGANLSVQPFWQALYDYGAEIVMVGHEHNYERFRPQDAKGNADYNFGVRQFVVGSGGGSHYTFSGTSHPNSEVRNGDTYGVLKLTLRATSYDWEFVPEAGKTFSDRGTGQTHGPPRSTVPAP